MLWAVTSNLRNHALSLGLVCAWLAVVVLMVLDHRRDPYDPSREATATYGHNDEGALAHGIVMTLVELVVFLVVLRPWGARRSTGRAAAALVLFGAWSVLSLVWVMHAGGIMAIHAVWVVVLAAVALGFFSWSAVASLLSAWRR
jgi:hypothetical protein